MLKYWKKTIDLLAIESQHLSRQIRPEIEKFGLYFHDQFIIELKEPVLIFVLFSTDAEGVSVTPLTGVELFRRLEQNAYRGEQLGFANLKKEHFSLFTRLANQCSSYLIERPNAIDSVVQIADIIEEKITTLMNNNID